MKNTFLIILAFVGLSFPQPSPARTVESVQGPIIGPPNVYFVAYDTNGGNVDPNDLIQVTAVFRTPPTGLSAYVDVPLFATTTDMQQQLHPSCPGSCFCYMDSGNPTRLRYNILSPPGCGWQPWGAFAFTVRIHSGLTPGQRAYFTGTHYWMDNTHPFGFTESTYTIVVGAPLP